MLVADGDGNVLRILGKPDSDLFGANTEFKPRDLVVTSAGTVYVLVEGVYQGAVIFSPDGEFAGFYGSNKVEVSLSLLADFFWKNFMTSAQKSRMRRYVPVQYSSIQIDSEDFVYLTTEAASSPSERVRKLNPLGQNILRSSSNDKLFFGDTGTFQLQGETYETALTAIDVIDGKYITVLDRSRSRIFQYNQECDLLTVFGCSGSLEGAFTEPVGLCGVGNNVFVLDAQRNAITVFELTPYGETLHHGYRHLHRRAVSGFPALLVRDPQVQQPVRPGQPGHRQGPVPGGGEREGRRVFRKVQRHRRVFQRLRGYPQGGNPGQLLRYRAGTRAADSRGLAV